MAGCGSCGSRRPPDRGNEVIGYRVTRPDGTVVPPANEPPFFSVIDARAEVLMTGGGTIKSVKRSSG